MALNLVIADLPTQTRNNTGFSSTELILKTATGDISGTLTLPDKPKRTPLVIIVAGSGPTDRDCNSTLGYRTNAYRMLAEDLALCAISTLRFDKRGIGKSMHAMNKEVDLRFENYVYDVVAWVNMLKQDKRFSKIILLGHSEGSLIAMLAAEQVGIASFISLAGVGRPADQILQEQLKSLPAPLLDESNAIMDSLRSGKTVSKINPSLFSIYRPSVQPYMISWMKYDPSLEIRKLRIPVLIIQGTNDIQVPVEDARLLAAAKPDARLLLIDNMNHVLKEADGDRQKNLATYNMPDLPLKAGLVDQIAEFVRKKK
jgi:uncharacterized protein